MSEEKEKIKISSKIIDMLGELNVADKVYIIGSLYRSLIDTIKDEGGVVAEEDKDSFS